MDIWSKYNRLGLWGLWRECFTVPYSVGVQDAEGAAAIVDLSGFALRSARGLPAKPVFYWRSGHGFELGIYSGQPVAPGLAELWSVLLSFEAVDFSRRPTFFPLCLPGDDFFDNLNRLLLQPPQVVLFNGQPGVGKRTLLQSLSLLHAGRLPDLSPQIVNQWTLAEGDLFIVPEVAMLEVEAQHAVLKAVQRGARLWAATAYDLGMLRSRKVITAAFADLLDDSRIHLPPVAKRAEAELARLASFWRSLYGEPSGQEFPNLEYLKRRVVAGERLSVGSILEEGRGLRGIVAEFEKEAIRQAYARVGRSQHKIARLLKVSRGSLQHKLRKYQLESYAAPDADTEEEG